MSFQAERESSDAQQALQTFWQKQIQEVRIDSGVWAYPNCRTHPDGWTHTDSWKSLGSFIFELGPISERYSVYS